MKRIQDELCHRFISQLMVDLQGNNITPECPKILGNNLVRILITDNPHLLMEQIEITQASMGIKINSFSLLYDEEGGDSFSAWVTLRILDINPNP